MRTFGSLVAIGLLALVAGLTAATAADEEPALDVAPAIRSAEGWLAIVDSGRYGTAWDDAAEALKDSVQRLRFETSLQSAREPLGVPISRKMRSATYARGLPGAPEAEYVVVEFDTVYEKRPRVMEKVTPLREKDGSWKVSGYFIR